MKKALEEPQGGVEEAMKPVNLAPSAPLVTMSQHCDVVVGGAEQGPGIKVAASFMGPDINVAASFILTGKKTDKILTTLIICLLSHLMEIKYLFPN